MYEGLNVHSEIGALKKVLVHRPGDEMIYFGDQDFDRVWFHDALFVEVAQKEHDAFTDLLRAEGAQVLYLENLLAEALDAKPEARPWFTQIFLDESGIQHTELRNIAQEFLDDIRTTYEFVLRVFRGIRLCEIDCGRLSSIRTLAYMESRSEKKDSLIDPLPSSYFTRDPFAVVGKGVNLSKMYWPNRNRETLLGYTIFTYHPEYRGTHFWYERQSPFHTEGGDVLNLDENTLAIGLSQRTEASAIDALAQSVFWHNESNEIQTIYAFKIPSSYAFMHLDTVFTQVDFDKFTIHPAILGTLKVYCLTKGSKKGEVDIRQLDETLEEILKKALHLGAIKLIECGKGDPVLAAREQWNDGSNTLCVSPGTVCVYERNVVTNEALDKEGLKLLVTPSAELSRGRGGPRCMSMPFWRQAL